MIRPNAHSAVTENVDVAIVGCGIAGGLLAGRLARDGFRTVAFEKRPLIGVPVRCGEAAGSREEVSHFVPVDENWVVAELDAARMYAPNLTYVERQMPGFCLMLNRDGFDQALAAQAQTWGAEVRTYHEVKSLLWDDDRVCGVQVKNQADGRAYDVKARVVIGADGVETFVARWAKLSTHFKPRHIHSAVEYVLEDVDFPTSRLEIYVGKEHAPGGYAWVFPKGVNKANVGLGVHPTMAKDGTARDYLDRFVKKFYPRAKVGKLVAGGVSGSKPLKTMVGNGVLLVGEAGHQNNPLSGGGIMNALEGAEEAHKVLRDALEKDDLSKGFLQRYDKAWHRRNGHLIEKFAVLRQLFFKLDDEDINNVIAALNTLVGASPGRITDYAEVFKTAFKAVPGVLWKTRKVLW
ncbi:MAG: NAD(P)/FAD-dependent oxidoreductase [Candidatus Krumholzibacteria bacterium]|nr:NAD(P)/FAD-dependent oxidoreductase [Candidatus Krumholzibacteria bacterium]